VPVGDRPALAHVVGKPRAAGIGLIVVNAHHPAGEGVAWLGPGTAGVDSHEPELRATPGVGEWTAQYIALRAARDGANIAIAAKTATPHPKPQGTIYTAAEEIERAGGKAFPFIWLL